MKLASFLTFFFICLVEWEKCIIFASERKLTSLVGSSFIEISMSTKVKISDFPEETDEGIKIYGPTSYETQVAILSHYLHSFNGKDDLSSKQKSHEIVEAIRDYIEYKRQHSKKEDKWEPLSDDEILMAAESPFEYNLFAEFFNVPFPAPKNPKFTFIDLFAGIGGFRIALQELGGKCVYSSEFDAQAQKTYMANYGEMPFGDIQKRLQKNIFQSIAVR